MSCGEKSRVLFALLVATGLLVLGFPVSAQPDAKSKEPPRDAKLGAKVDGIALGIWSEKSTYSPGEIRNVWVIEEVDEKSRMSPEQDQAFHAYSKLEVSRSGKTVKVIPVPGVEDGVVGMGFEGGISSDLKGLVPGTYELAWKIGSRISNPVIVTITK